MSRKNWSEIIWKTVPLINDFNYPIDCSPPGSSVHGISQARTLEWVAISSSRDSSQLRNWPQVSCISCIAGGFFTTEPTGKPLCWILSQGRQEQRFCFKSADPSGPVDRIQCFHHPNQDLIASWGTNFCFKMLYLEALTDQVQFSSVTQSCLTPCNPVNRSTPGLPVHHQLLEFTQTHVHRVGDAIQPSHPLSSLSPPAPQSLPASRSFLMSQLFAWGSQSIGISASASVLPMNTQDWSSLGWTGWISLQSKGLSRVFSNTTVQKH